MKYNKKHSIFNRLSYQFDKSVARGPWVIAAWLAGISIGLVLLITLIANAVRIDPNKGFWELLWDMLLQALVANPVDVKAGTLGFLLLMLLITFISIFMVSIFIGIATNIIDNKVQSLREGRSPVLEKNHTLILGWDEHVFTIISELMIANDNQQKSCIVILGEKDKVAMENEIRARIGPSRHTQIVCRNGSPMDLVDLGIVSLETAKSIIVLAPDCEDADSCVIKTLLAITHVLGSGAKPYIVTEIDDAFNFDAARLAGKNQATVLLMSDIIAHITAQTCRQSGLSVVYTELLNFEGDEIYFQEEPALVGRTFGEAIFMYENSTVMGLRPKDGKPQLNPPMNTIIREGDKIIAISEDDDTVILSGIEAPPVQNQWVQVRTPVATDPERTLILGWNKQAPTIITELDHYVPPGSEVKVVANRPEPEAEVQLMRERLINQTVVYQQGNTAARDVLESLLITTYKHIILLADQDGVSIQIADARTLVTLLHIRDIDEHTGHPFSIVSEMLDVRNRNLAAVARADDFIVSHELASLLMTQISENKELYEVFEDLFYSEGSEIFLKPISDYICLDQPVNFYTVLEAARQKNEVALGYRRIAHAADEKNTFGVVVNPVKSETVTFEAGDRVIVLAES